MMARLHSGRQYRECRPLCRRTPTPQPLSRTAREWCALTHRIEIEMSIVRSDNLFCSAP